MEEVRKYLEKAAGDWRIQAGLAAAAISLLAVYYVGSASWDTRLDLRDEVELKYIEDNNIGSAVLQRSSSSLTTVEEPELKACIYSGEENPPIILPVETEKVLLSSDLLETLSLNITIPEKRLGENYPSGNVNITRMEKCPLRSSPQIVITKRK